MGREEQTLSHIPEESLFLASEMNGQMLSVEWGDWLLPRGLGHSPGRVLQGTMESWKHMDRARWGRGVDRNGGSLADQWGCPLAWAVAAQWLLVVLGGPGQTLVWASLAQTGSGAPGPKRRAGNKELPYPRPLHK